MTGSSRFYLSFEDNLLRLFGSPKLREMMVNNIEGDDAIEARIISRSIENAQRKVEGHNFDIRKNLLDYDDVSNDQRQVIYQQRMELMSSMIYPRLLRACEKRFYLICFTVLFRRIV